MAKKKSKAPRKTSCKTPGRRIRSGGRGKGLARGKGKGPVGRPTRRSRPNPTSLAKTIISRVARPGSTFSLSALKAGLRKAGYRNVKGWFDQMIADAKRLRLLTPVSKSVYAFTPAAANPSAYARPTSRKKKR